MSIIHLCQKASPAIGAGETCVHLFADGWLTSQDLCPPCTALFMAALDAAVGAALPWHQNYRDRAEGAEVPEAPLGAAVANMVGRACLEINERHNAALASALGVRVEDLVDVGERGR